MNTLALRNQSNGLSLIDNIFSDFFNDNWLSFSEIKNQEPAYYFYDEKTGEYTITAQAPGFSREDIELEVVDDGIKLVGEIKNEDLKKRIGEKKFSYFMKVKNVNYKDVEAKLENGILEVKFKTKEKDKISKKIEIK